MPTARITFSYNRIYQFISTLEAGYPPNGLEPYHVDSVLVGESSLILRDDDDDTYVTLLTTQEPTRGVSDGLDVTCLLDEPADQGEVVIPEGGSPWNVFLRMSVSAPLASYAGFTLYVHNQDDYDGFSDLYYGPDDLGWQEIGHLACGVNFPVAWVTGSINPYDYIHGPQALFETLLNTSDYVLGFAPNIGTPSTAETIVHPMTIYEGYIEFDYGETPSEPVEAIFDLARCNFVRS